MNIVAKTTVDFLAGENTHVMCILCKDGIVLIPGIKHGGYLHTEPCHYTYLFKDYPAFRAVYHKHAGWNGRQLRALLCMTFKSTNV